METCPICSRKEGVRSTGLDPLSQNYHVICPICGEYKISDPLKFAGIENYGNPIELSAFLRNRHELRDVINITIENIETIFQSVAIPRFPVENIDLLLEHLARKTDSKSDFIELNPTIDYPLIYARNHNEFIYYIDKANELKYIEIDLNTRRTTRYRCRLTISGWKRFSELVKSTRKTDQAFVAMWFDKSMDVVWKEGFELALRKTGYRNPIRIDLTEHNEKICDRIIAEIRKSSLVIADFTGQRGGVYFEAGFAMGLGIPVIWTCKECDIENLHFDTRQYNHIVWINPDDLKNKLINRIEATIPGTNN